MALQIAKTIENKATDLTYWRYEGISRFVFDPMYSIKNQPAPKVAILLGGYSSASAREAAKDKSRAPDQTLEFLIVNWVETVEESRPATLEEKKAGMPELVTAGLTDEQIEKADLNIKTGEHQIVHNDFDAFMAAFNTPNEGAVAYSIIKTSMNTVDFFQGATDA